MLNTDFDVSFCQAEAGQSATCNSQPQCLLDHPLIFVLLLSGQNDIPQLNAVLVTTSETLELLNILIPSASKERSFS